MTAPTLSALGPTRVRWEGRDLLAFAGCNYLGLSFHPEVHDALQQGLARYGISAAASRQTSGDVEVYGRLESALAELVGLEAALLLPNGYTANLALAEVLALAGPEAATTARRSALLDARSHRSLFHAFEAAGFEIRTYPAGDVDAVRSASRRDASTLLVTDGVFAADGAVASLDRLASALPEGATLVVDDCHGLGVIGPRGAGSLACHGLAGEATAGAPGTLCVTGTLAKAYGCCGGFVAGPRAVIETVRSGSSIFVGSTPVPPALACAALKAIQVAAEDERVHARLDAAIRRMRDALTAAGVELRAQPTPIFAFTLPGDGRRDADSRMRAVHAALLEAGIFAPLISYPGGPAPMYFRLTVSALHGAEEIERLGREMKRLVGGVA